ncbi:hypothetical protein M3559_03505 [Staphylococcus equorum]|nr:hypothetical protein [Staphylococcus equorum]MCM3071718.1 hypothetical protein [Staphylococcus equorum]
MWLILLLITVTILLIGFVAENGRLQGKVDAREYEKKVLEERIKQLEG